MGLDDDLKHLRHLLVYQYRDNFDRGARFCPCVLEITLTGTEANVNVIIASDTMSATVLAVCQGSGSTASKEMLEEVTGFAMPAIAIFKDSYYQKGALTRGMLDSLIAAVLQVW